jgi:hypothetical protein
MRDPAAEQSRKSLYTGPDPLDDLGAGALSRSMHLGSKRLKKDFGGQRNLVTTQSQNASMLKLARYDPKAASKIDGIVLLSGEDDVVNMQYPNPATGYKKVVLPSLRERDRVLSSNKISIQNLHVNRSLRRYMN